METIHIDQDTLMLTAMLPTALRWDATQFESAWQIKPSTRHKVKIFGEFVEVARYQQAFGATYAYSGSINEAMPVPGLLVPLLRHVQSEIDHRLQGILLNWYDGCEDYIGAHRDTLKGLVPGSPIVTVSFGETRTFRLTKGKGKSRQVVNQTAEDGRVFVMPWETNLAWKHCVPKSKRNTGRRISVTFRVFETGVLPADTYFAGASQ